MIQLTICEKDPGQVQLRERLDDLSLARSINVDNSIGEPLLIDGDEEVRGAEKIADYLDQMQVFMKAWYACRCDMYPE